jgi:hypothetical protein
MCSALKGNAEVLAGNFPVQIHRHVYTVHWVLGLRDKQVTGIGAVGVHTAYATFSFDSSEGAEYAVV